MIDQTYTASGISPRRWENLGMIVNAILPMEKTLYILLDHGVVCNVFHPDRGLCALPVDPEKPDKSARALLAADVGLDCVLFLEKEAVPRFLAEVNGTDVSGMDAVSYIGSAYRSFYNQEGVKAYWRKSRSWDFYEKLSIYLAEKFPSHCSIALAVFNGNALFFDLILTLRSHEICAISSFDGLFPDVELTKEDEPRMREAFCKKPDTFYFHLEKEELFGWIERFPAEA